MKVGNHNEHNGCVGINSGVISSGTDLTERNNQWNVPPKHCNNKIQNINLNL